MTYGELKAQFIAILNRTDITDTLAATFMSMGMQRFQRDLRTPLQEVSLDITITTTTSLPVPSDLIEMISISVNNQIISFLPYTKFIDIVNNSVGQPVFWTRRSSTILMNPAPAAGAIVNMYYYGEFTPFTADSQTTSVSLVAPDLLIYSALKYAADYYIDERASAFEDSYQQIKQSIQDQAYYTDGGNSIQPAYNLDES